jgi:CBS domain-containing protein
MSDFPLPGLTDFLKKVVPFNTLDPLVLQKVIQTTQVAFYPAGELIIRMGEPSGGFLYVIQTGCARVAIRDESGDSMLVDFRGEGDSFGAVSLLKGGNAMFDVSAEEDLIAFLIPKATIDILMAEHAPFRRFFGSSLARNFKAVRKSADDQLDLLTRDNQLQLDMYLTGKKVLQLMATDLLTCPPRTPVREAAGRMKQRGVGSIIVIADDGSPQGIITDADLRSKVVAEGLDLNTPVHRVMSTPICTVLPEAYAFDALLDMGRFGVSHLIVTENQRAVGIVSEHDFQMEIGSSPIGMIADISAARTVAELVGKRIHIDRILEMAMHRSGAVKPMVDLISELNDRVARQFMHIIENEMRTESWGPPPVAYSWLTMGSQGRREQTLCTDQDNALIYADVPPDQEPPVKAWFLEFARRVVDALECYGIPKCQGGIIASNPQWSKRLGDWCALFRDWVETPTPESLRLATIFFDFRGISKDAVFARHLRKELTRLAAGKQSFARDLAKISLVNRPPLGFLRQFVVESSGEHTRGLNLKLRGLTPVVDAARVLALELGETSTNTLERLGRAAEKKIVRSELLAAIDDAYDYINWIRINHHLKAGAAGRPLTNLVDPALLNPMERKILKESFTIIGQLQELLGVRYKNWRGREG